MGVLAVVLAVAFLPVVSFVAVVVAPSDTVVWLTAFGMGAAAVGVGLVALASPGSSVVNRNLGVLAVALMVVQGPAFLAVYAVAIVFTKSM